MEKITAGKQMEGGVGTKKRGRDVNEKGRREDKRGRELAEGQGDRNILRVG